MARKTGFSQLPDKDTESPWEGQALIPSSSQVEEAEFLMNTATRAEVPFLFPSFPFPLYNVLIAYIYVL